MKRRAVLLILMALLGCNFLCYAENKSDKLKPKWVTHQLPNSQSESYFFVKSHGEGTSLAGAKQMAFIAMSQRLEQERGITFSTSIQSRERLYQNQYGSGSEYQQEITLEITEDGHQIKIICREIDDYWIERNGKYEADVLYTVSNKRFSKGSNADEIVVTSKYGTAGFLSIIPGVGQLHKGCVAKGSLILAGEVAAVGGIALCESTRASYIKKMKEQPKYASEYNSLADSWATARNVTIGAAVAIYAYNLIDAFVSPGAKHVIVNNRTSSSLSLVPYCDNYSTGVTVALLL